MLKKYIYFPFNVKTQTNNINLLRNRIWSCWLQPEQKRTVVVVGLGPDLGQKGIDQHTHYRCEPISALVCVWNCTWYSCICVFTGLLMPWLWLFFIVGRVRQEVEKAARGLQTASRIFLFPLSASLPDSPRQPPRPPCGHPAHPFWPLPGNCSL